MLFVYFNPNPDASRVGDCSVRALCKALGKEWDEVYLTICIYGLLSHDMPSGNHVWGRYLHDMRFRKKLVSYENPPCTVETFANRHKKGIYVLVLDNHVVTLSDGCWNDTWDSGQEVVLYYWTKEE